MDTKRINWMNFYKGPFTNTWGTVMTADNEMAFQFNNQSPNAQELFMYALNNNTVVPKVLNPEKYRYEESYIYYEDREVISIRGYGHLTGTGGLNLPEHIADAVQDRFGEYLLSILNGKNIDLDLLDSNSVMDLLKVPKELESEEKERGVKVVVVGVGNAGKDAAIAIAASKSNVVCANIGAVDLPINLEDDSSFIESHKIVNPYVGMFDSIYAGEKDPEPLSETEIDLLRRKHTENYYQVVNKTSKLTSMQRKFITILFNNPESCPTLGVELKKIKSW